MFVCQQCATPFSEAGYCCHDGTPLVPAAQDPLIGTKIGPYKLDSLIGVGGMGRVYKGVHPTIESRVAVKVLAHDCASDQGVINRFFDEARAVNVIRHENIVNILDLDFLPDRRPYIVMEFLDGTPLSNIAGDGRALPVGTTLRMIEEVLNALAAAHQQQIVHRDLKPDNIIISPQGRPKVLDFGIAKLSADHSNSQERTREGSLLGTPHYMSPEQAQGQTVDARADIYAMGVILFECLTGKKPFHADNLFELLRLHVEVPPPAPRSIRPVLSVNLENIVLCALAKDPNQRWQRVEEFAAALQQEQHGLQPSEWATLVPGGASSTSSHTPSRTPVGLSSPSPRAPAPSAAPPIDHTTTTVDPKPNRHTGAWALLAVGMVAMASGAWYLGSRSAEETDKPRAEQPIASGAPQAPVLQPVASSAPKQPVVVVSSPDAAVPTIDAAPLADARRKRQPDTLVKKAPRQPKRLTPPEATTPKNHVPSRSSSKTSGAARFDAKAYLRKATATAKRAFDDAALIRIDLQGVRPNGKADLTLSDSFSATYRYVSPSRAKRPAKLPAGVPFKSTCAFYVVVSANSTDNYPLEWNCTKMRPIGRPRCSPRDIWKRAITDGAPSKNAVASLGFHRSGGNRLWYFTIRGSFSNSYPDDC